MLVESHTAVVARNEWIGDGAAIEPYEAGWAREAIFFVRALDVRGDLAGATAAVQISPDGLRWIDEGSRLELPAEIDGLRFCRVSAFGHWLRLRIAAPGGGEIKLLATLALKG